MATIEEITRAIKILNNKNIILLHCVSDYPTNLKDMNLKFMTKLKKYLTLQLDYLMITHQGYYHL